MHKIQFLIRIDGLNAKYSLVETFHQIPRTASTWMAAGVKFKIGAADISALFKTTKAPKKWQNDAIMAKRCKFLALG